MVKEYTPEALVLEETKNLVEIIKNEQYGDAKQACRVISEFCDILYPDMGDDLEDPSGYL